MAKIEEEETAAAPAEKTPEEEQAERERERREQEALPYRWKQTLQDVSINVPLPHKVKGRDCIVELKKTSIKVGLKGSPTILEDGQEISIHLEKQNQQAWWDSVVVGAPKIDTTKIQPENSKLSDLDGETRAMVEKMMFDNQQRQMGKPTSDELKKQEMLQKFMKEHPEMQFSPEVLAQARMS